MLYDIPSELVAKVLRYTPGRPWAAEEIARDLRKLLLSKDAHRPPQQLKEDILDGDEIVVRGTE